MHKQEGFTIVELLIVIVITICLGLIIWSVARGINGGNYCDMYRYSSVQDVPVSCFDYLTNGDGSQK